MFGAAEVLSKWRAKLIGEDSGQKWMAEIAGRPGSPPRASNNRDFSAHPLSRHRVQCRDKVRRLVMDDSSFSIRPEWKLLLACASPGSAAAVGERVRVILTCALDWSYLFALAEDHGVSPLLARCLNAHCADQVPSIWRGRLQEQRRSHLFFVLSLTAELFRVVELFESEGIEAAVFKGPALAVQAFGDAALRQYSDLDLFLQHRDVLRAYRLLLAHGYETRLRLREVESGKVPGQFLFTRPGSPAVVEVHTERTLRYVPRPLPVEAMLARRASVRLDGRDVPSFSPEDTLALISIHGSKHFWDRLMWIADVAALGRREPPLDWVAALRFASELGATRMLRLGLCLARELLDAPLADDLAKRAAYDRAASRLASQVSRRLFSDAQAAPGVLERAWFRMRMRGSLAAGVPYLLRLTFAPTEEDWGTEGATRSRISSAFRRPFRLLRKYGIEGR